MSRNCQRLRFEICMASLLYFKAFVIRSYFENCSNLISDTAHLIFEEIVFSRFGNYFTHLGYNLLTNWPTNPLALFLSCSHGHSG